MNGMLPLFFGPWRAWALSGILLTSVANFAHAGAAKHHCADDALQRATKLLSLQSESDLPASVSKTVTTLPPIRNPANRAQKFDVLAVTGFVYKTEYRMRFLYAQFPDQCALVGQEILEHGSL